jgi:hypothetical protein
VKRLAFIFVISLFPVYAGTLDDTSAAVVLLTTPKPQTTVIDGVTYEVGIRRTGEAKFTPASQTLSGTGFFVSHGGQMVLVTAAHVARELTPDSTATLQAGLQRSRGVSLRDLTGWQGQLRWHFHSVADVALVVLKPAESIRPLLSQHFIPSEALAAAVPSRDLPLTILGFPLSLGAQAYFSPLTRETRAASGDIAHKDGYRFFLLQDPSVGGYSGAPVLDLGAPVLSSAGISIRQAGLVCYGVVSATIPDETGGKFALVIPARYVRELLDQL